MDNSEEYSPYDYENLSLSEPYVVTNLLFGFDKIETV